MLLLLLLLITGSLNNLYKAAYSVENYHTSQQKTQQSKYETCLMLLRHQKNVNELILVSLLSTLTRYHTTSSSAYYC